MVQSDTCSPRENLYAILSVIHWSSPGSYYVALRLKIGIDHRSLLYIPGNAIP
jgi:hypothetical protein